MSSSAPFATWTDCRVLRVAPFGSSYAYQGDCSVAALKSSEKMSFHPAGPAGTVGVGLGVAAELVGLGVGELVTFVEVARPRAVVVGFAVALPARADFARAIAVATLTGDCAACAPAAALRAPPVVTVPHPAAAVASTMASTPSHRPELTAQPLCGADVYACPSRPWITYAHPLAE
jgi:hypothetical protein